MSDHESATRTLAIAHKVLEVFDGLVRTAGVLLTSEGTAMRTSSVLRALLAVNDAALAALSSSAPAEDVAAQLDAIVAQAKAGIESLGAGLAENNAQIDGEIAKKFAPRSGG